MIEVEPQKWDCVPNNTEQRSETEAAPHGVDPQLARLHLIKSG
jgi:hypothetical protein